MRLVRDPFRNLLIAEVGSVHDGSFGNALKMVDLAVAAGANSVKFQTHLPDFETTPSATRPPHFNDEDRGDYFRRTSFSAEQWERLRDHTEEQGALFLSSVFSLEAVDLLEELGVSIHKIPSGEITNLPLIERIGAAGKPVLLSTGMGNWAEIDHALDALSGAPEVCLLQCTSLYPCPPEHVGLNILSEMRARYGSSVSIGFSDHSTGLAAAVGAAALGARVIEKHLTFSREMYGSDAPFASEPAEFRAFCSEVKTVWSILEHSVSKDNLEPMQSARQSFLAVAVAASDLPAGHTMRKEDIVFRKAGDGILPREAQNIAGRRLAHPKEKLSPFGSGDFEGGL